MTKRTKLSVIATGAVMVLVLALGVTAVFAQTGDGDVAPDTGSQTLPPLQPEGQRGIRGSNGMPGQFGPPEGLTAKDELLADALNIDLETLEAAQESARATAIEQALAEGLITEEQAEMLLESPHGFGFHRGRGSRGFGESIDHEANLAEALNISIEELQDARQAAHEAALAELVDAGYLTEEQVDLMAAQQALKEAIDREALLAEVLDVSVTELEAARTDRESMAALIEESGLTRAELTGAMQAAHEAAVEQAIEDGVITSEQYEALQSAGPAGRGFGGGHGCGGHGRGGQQGFPGQGGPGGNSEFRGFGQPSGAPSTTGASI